MPSLASDLNLSSTNTQGTEYTENLLLFSQKQPLFFHVVQVNLIILS